MLTVALKNAGMDDRDETTKTRKISFHIFRAFFLSQLKLVISPEIPEMLAGHEGYLSANYRNYPQKQALEEYLKGVKMVTFEMPQDVREIQNKIEKELGENNQLVRNLVIENQQLKTEIAEVKKENQQIKNAIEEFREKYLKVDLDSIKKELISYIEIEMKSTAGVKKR
jgi:predicted metal-dependent hydrolase